MEAFGQGCSLSSFPEVISPGMTGCFPRLGRLKPDYAALRPESGIIGYGFWPCAPLRQPPRLGRPKPDYAALRPESGIIGYDHCPGLLGISWLPSAWLTLPPLPSTVDHRACRKPNPIMLLPGREQHNRVSDFAHPTINFSTVDSSLLSQQKS